MSYKLILFLAIFSIGCSSKTTKKSIDKVTANVVVVDDECFEGRKIVNTIKDLEVSITEKSNRFYFVNEYTHYEPCEMPSEYAKEGKRCVISGDVLEIYPTERRAGTPFILKSIK